MCFYEGIKCPKYQRAICGIEKKKSESSEWYELVNHSGECVWKSREGKNIITGLSKKSKQYYRDRGEFQNHRIWIIGTKKEGDKKWIYKNVASCCRESFNGEINEHIKQLIEKGQTQKDKRYFGLWEDNNKIAFFEILIDEYIASQIIEDQYLSSIISQNEELQDSNLREIRDKNRMSFIEGKIAAKYEMKKNGIWFPSGAGIDGDVYQYYMSKNLNCDIIENIDLKNND